MGTAFITGSGGFIGGHIVDEFVARGRRVHALVHRRLPASLRRAAESGAVSIVEGDITDADDLQRRFTQICRKARPECVVHCAGRASDVGRRREFRTLNYDSVRHLVRIVREHDIPRLVFVSSTDVYGLHDFRGQDEDELPLDMAARNPYPFFKIRAEQHIRASLPPERYAIIRPGAVWGVGDPTLAPRIVSFLRWSPRIVHFGKWRGRNRWPLAHVRNVAAAAFLCAGGAETAGQAVNVLDNEVTTLDEFYRLLAEICLPGARRKELVLPVWCGKAFGAVVSGISNLLNLDRPPADPSLYAVGHVCSNLDFSNRRLRRLFETAGREMVTRRQGLDELRNFSA